MGDSFGICAYCNAERPLRRSHSIPDAIFRSVKKRSRGQLAAISRSGPTIKRTQDSGAAYLLCEACEQGFNERFDRKIVQAIRKLHRSANQSGVIVGLSISGDDLTRAVASILWRACLSASEMYDALNLRVGDSYVLRSVFESQDPLSECSLMASYVIDRHGVFSLKDLQSIISVPEPFSVNKPASEQFGISVVLQGLHLFIIFPRVPPAKRRIVGYVRRNTNSVSVRGLDWRDFPPLRATMHAAMKGALDERDKRVGNGSR